MYLEYWGLSDKPFENTPDPKFLFNSSQHEEALARMLYVVREGKGAGVLTGVFGCGKTVLSRVLLSELEQDIYRVAMITNPRLSEIDLLKMIIHYLGVSKIPQSKAEILIALEDILNNNLRDGKKTVIVVDEAHSIEEKGVFEEIRLLLNFQKDDRFLLTLLMFGQPELKEKIETNKQLLQRIAIRYHLSGLDINETRDYIVHRLQIAGGTGVGMTAPAIKLIFERSTGIPRRINQICDISLMTGFMKNVKVIDDAIVMEAIKSIEQ